MVNIPIPRALKWPLKTEVSFGCLRRHQALSAAGRKQRRRGFQWATVEECGRSQCDEQWTGDLCWWGCTTMVRCIHMIMNMIVCVWGGYTYMMMHAWKTMLHMRMQMYAHPFIWCNYVFIVMVCVYFYTCTLHTQCVSWYRSPNSQICCHRSIALMPWDSSVICWVCWRDTYSEYSWQPAAQNLVDEYVSDF